MWNNNWKCSIKGYLHTLLGSFSSFLQYPIYFKRNWLYIPKSSWAILDLGNANVAFIVWFPLYWKRDNQNVGGALFKQRNIWVCAIFVYSVKYLFSIKNPFNLVLNLLLDLWFPVSFKLLIFDQSKKHSNGTKYFLNK